jgi:hypothetical protein
MNDLELILKYKMNDTEAKAYKLILLYEELCQKEFPNERHIKVSKNKDPRKTTIFKYCYKLIRETNGIFKEKDYYLYILAQLQILKLIKDGNIHALIGPQILVGDKAWKRWKIWKKKYDKKMNKITNPTEGIITNENSIKKDLQRTLEFLIKNKCLEINQFINKSDDIVRWIKTGKISPYYVVLSPIISEFSRNNNLDNFDFTLYRPSITPSLEQYFREEFKHEFTT